jgi:hypothetical protein
MLRTTNVVIPTDTPLGRYVALFLTDIEIFQVSESQNQSAETPYTEMSYSHHHLDGMGKHLANLFQENDLRMQIYTFIFEYKEYP